MGKISPSRRSFEIRKKQKRREKIKKLKEKFQNAKSEKEREEILKKIERIARIIPWKRLLSRGRNRGE